MGTIINLAQNFIGSNNCNLLLPIGQFGTRLHGGKDAASPRYIFTNLSPLTRILFNQKDDPLFEYLNDDGQRVEPEHYCPILPMLLVNGAEGIGTGWATKVPNFNPRQLIENIQRLIKGQDPLPMKPYYKNFRGQIDQIDDTKFLVSGEVSILDEESKGEFQIEISELPVGVWTQVYKETVLEAYLYGTDTINTTNKPAAPFTQLISDYKEYHTDCTVRFVVKMNAKQFEYANDQGLHKFFKLQKTISLSNMVMFDSKGCLRRYETPIEILKEFFLVRLAYYVKRKAYMVDMLGAESCKLDNVARFIVEKIRGELKVEGLKKNDLIKLLGEKGYDSDPVRKWKERVVKERGYLHEAVVGSAIETDEDDVNNSKQDYNYLLSMPLWNLTLEKKEEILRQQKEKNLELEKLKTKSVEEMWLDDLGEFSVELDRVESQEKADLEVKVIKKSAVKSGSSGFNVDKFLKRKSGGGCDGGSVVKSDYLPSVSGERVEAKIDAQLVEKCLKEAMQKEVVKSKKDDEGKVMNIVDVVSNETAKFSEEELKQIENLTQSLLNTSKAR